MPAYPQRSPKIPLMNPLPLGVAGITRTARKEEEGKQRKKRKNNRWTPVSSKASCHAAPRADWRTFVVAVTKLWLQAPATRVRPHRGIPAVRDAEFCRLAAERIVPRVRGRDDRSDRLSLRPLLRHVHPGTGRCVEAEPPPAFAAWSMAHPIPPCGL